MTDKICPDCNGHGTVVIRDENNYLVQIGFIDGTVEVCDYCDGTGRVSVNASD